MPISGLVITLARDDLLAREAMSSLLARHEILAGSRNEQWLPVAVEGRDETHCRELHDWIGALPGVEFVDVVSVNFEGDAGAESPQPVSQGEVVNPHP